MSQSRSLLYFVAACCALGFFFILKSPQIHNLTSIDPKEENKMVQPKDFVLETVKSHKVVVFSKTYCPYCKKAKAALNSLLEPSQYDVIELDERDDGDALQDALLEVTGGRSVPRVFVGGQFIGGGDDTAAKAASGELKQLLHDAGAL